jgi:hypothetical protein
MKQFKKIGLALTLCLFGYHLYSLDYEDLRFTTNRFHYMQMVVMTLIAVSFLLGILKDRKPNS